MKRFLASGCLAVFMIWPSLSSAAPLPAATADAALVASARPTIDAADNEWLPAMQAHDAAKIAEPYARDALFILADGKTVRGRVAIREMYQAGFRKPGKIVSGRLVEDGLVAAGSLIYEWGHARLLIDRDKGKPVISAGKYLTVWQRGPSGQWQIIRNLVF